MNDKETIERIKNLKGKAECALLTDDKKEHWLYEDVQETVASLDMAIKALEKQDKLETKIRQLQARCYVFTGGTLCGFCAFAECEHYRP